MKNLLRPCILCIWATFIASYSFAQSNLIITGVIDGPLSGGVPKAIELYATDDIPDLGIYGLESANNGNAASGPEFTFTGAATAGDFIYVASEEAGFNNFFSFFPDATGAVASINGDDVILLYQNGSIVDVFGETGMDGSGEDWEYTDGWSYRVNGSGPDDNTFDIANWILSGPDALDGATTNATAGTPFPLGTYDNEGNGGGTAELAINEIRIDQPGRDDDEYFELFGTAGATLEGYTYLVIGDGSGGSGVIEAVIDLSGQSIPSDGFFLAAENTFSLATPDFLTPLNFENSDNVTHLLVSDFSGSRGDDLDADDNGTLDVNPWTAIIDAVALIASTDGSGDQVYSTNTVGPDGSFVPGYVYRLPDGTGDFRIGSFDPANDDTPGEPNQDDNGGGEESLQVFIHDIQGSGFESPIDGQSVIIEGIVVADFQDGDGDAFQTDLDGFYVQEEAADFDDNEATSEGIFVFAPGAADVQVGEVVKVSGKVTEFNGLTEITNVSSIEIMGNTNLPAPVPLTLPAADAMLEAVEGMYVILPQELVISEYFNFDRFGEIVLGLPLEGRDLIYQPTSYVDPENQQTIQDILEAIDERTLTLDDGRSAQNPDPARHPNGKVFDLENRFRGGDIVQNTIGVLSYSFNEYRIQPTEGADYIAANPRTDQPQAVGGSLKVASFNVLNYFTTFEGPNARGAGDQTEFERQRAKIIAALSIINAEIVGLIEIENNTEAIENLVSGLNAKMGEGTYEYINTGIIGTDAIKVAFIYKPEEVEPLGDYAVLTTEVDPRFIDTRNRPALAQTFLEKKTDQVLTVVVNHLKSKGSGCGEGDDDLYQGNCNLTRTQAAEAIVDWLATDPTNSGDPDYMIIGDLNAYDEEDPIQAILEGGDDVEGTEDDFVDLLKEFEGEFAYSYVFDAQFGYLDYALVSSSLYQQISGATAWHINSEEPDILDYDITFKKDAQDALYEPNPYRSSDHDPLIVGLALSPAVCTQEPTLPERGRSGKLVYPKLVIFPAPEYDASGVAQRIKLLSFSENDELIVISKNPISAIPQDGKDYQASEVFGKGEQISDGVYVIGKDNDWMSQYTVSGLEPSTQYYVAVFILSQGDDCGPNYLEEAVAHKRFITQKAKFYEGFEDLIDKLKDRALNVYPNPIEDVFYINIPSNSKQQVELKLSDLKGNTVSLGRFKVKEGDNKLEIDVRNLQLNKNLYLLKVTSHKQHYPVIRLSVE